MTRSVSRRAFVERACLGSAAGFLAVPRWWPALIGHDLPAAGDPMLRDVIAAALEAAQSAGASYADARVTVSDTDQARGVPSRQIVHAVGVRALVDGNWGFASDVLFTRDAVARLGRDAARQARASAWAGRGGVELDAAPPVVADGRWATPMRRDPFTMPLHERDDFFVALIDRIRRADEAIRNVQILASFMRVEKTYGSTLGTFTAQTRYVSAIEVTMYVVRRGQGIRWGLVNANQPGGFEIVADVDYIGAVPGKVREAIELLESPVEPVEIGRYDVVFDSAAAASLVSASVATATELDRALGYEANAGGTSYLGSPAQMLGTFQVGSPLLTVTADRSDPHGLATVGWDDEGVVPTPTTVVDRGILTDYLTTREFATDPQLASWYARRGWAQRSHGCADSESARYAPVLHTPNMTMAPGTGTASMADLIADTKTGYAVMGGGLSMDQQCLNGQLAGALVRRIHNGTLGAIVTQATVVFRAPGFWKNLSALGGRASAEPTKQMSGKGEPGQGTPYTVSAPPMQVRQVDVITGGRRS
jgi:TldD protein